MTVRTWEEEKRTFDFHSRSLVIDNLNGCVPNWLTQLTLLTHEDVGIFIGVCEPVSRELRYFVRSTASQDCLCRDNHEQFIKSSETFN